MVDPHSFVASIAGMKILTSFGLILAPYELCNIYLMESELSQFSVISLDQCVCLDVWTVFSYYRPAAGCLYLLPCIELFYLAGSWAAQLLWHGITATILERATPPRHSWVAPNSWPLLSWRQMSLLCNTIILFHQEFIIIKNAWVLLLQRKVKSQFQIFRTTQFLWISAYGEEKTNILAISTHHRIYLLDIACV